MKVVKSISILFILLSAVIASASNALIFFHETPQGVVKGENVTLEVMLTAANAGLYDMHLLYREIGSTKYRSMSMQRDGFLYSATIHTSNFNSGQMEYYIAYEGRLGRVGTIPEMNAEMNPYLMRIAPARLMKQTNSVEVVVLSPEPGEVVANDELIIAASLLGLEEDFDLSKTTLMIDGTNVTSLIDFTDGVITFSPSQIRGGFHNIELNVFDAQKNVLGKKEWSFRATEAADADAASFYRGSLFLDNRYQNISETSNNYFRTGATFSGRQNKAEYALRLVVSSEEASDRQPVNRYAGQVRYNFSDRNNVYLKGGDFTPFYNPLAFQNKRVRGLQTGLALGAFTFDFIYGQLNRGIDGSFTIDSVTTGDPVNPFVIDTLQGGGTYKKHIIAFRPGFRLGESVAWNINLMNSKDDPESIEFGSNAKESVVAGTDLSLKFDKRRIQFDASVQASLNNSDAGGAEITFDDLAEFDESLADNSAAESAFNFLESTNLLSLTQGLNPLPSVAMQVEGVLRYFHNNLQIKYFNIAQNFASPGNPYLLKDISGLYAVDHFRMFDNQVFLNLFYRGSNFNKSKDDLATSNNEVGASISYFPLRNIPSVTLGFTNIGRSNSASGADSLLFEDNTTQSINFSTSYNVDVSKVRNTVSLNVTNYVRDESAAVRRESNSDFTLFGLGLRSKFVIPLTSRINYSQSESIFGSSAKTSTNIRRIFLGLEYQIANLIQNDIFKPFLNLTFQNIDTEVFSTTTETSRNNYTLGFSYRSMQYGTLSLRLDQISYEIPDIAGGMKSITDSVINTRYQYNF